MASKRVDDRDLKRGARVLKRIEDDLKDPEDLTRAYAEAVLAQAVRNASSRPTPQAPMAADVLGVSGNIIRPLTGGPPSEVGTSAEFGSDIYLQFHKPHNPRGYWLLPAGEAPDVLDAADRALEGVLERAILRG